MAVLAVPTQSRRVLRFGDFEADLRSGELRRDGLKIKLQEQPFQVLAVLLANPGEVVTREELRQRLWPADTFVDFDDGLNTTINKLRTALGDSAESPRFIETLPKRGYRFLAKVSGADDSTVSSVAVPAHPGRLGATGRSRWALGLLVAAVALGVIALTLRQGQQAAPAKGPPQIHSVVVLPLDNLSGDPDQQYLADGMTDVLTTNLAQVRSLRVVSRTSAMRYKAGQKPVGEIARELGVDALVEGSVVRDGSRVRITAQLIDAGTDRHLWAGSYEAEVRDTLTVQGRIARDIAREVRVTLTPAEEQRLGKALPVQPEAYEDYLKGRYFLEKKTEEPVQRAIAYFRAAIKADPSYPPAYVGLANSYVRLGFFGARPPGDVYPSARAAARAALDRDDSLGAAHAAMAEVLFWYDWDWEGAEREYKRAIDLDPTYAPTRQSYSNLLLARRRFPEAIAEAEQARTLEPLSLTVSTHLGWALYRAGRNQEAITQYQKTLEMDPHFGRARRDLAMAYVQTGRFADAIREMQRAIEDSEPSPLMLSSLGYCYAMAQETKKAHGVLAQMERLSKSRYVSAQQRALVYAGLGDKDHTIAWLERAYHERSGQMAWLAGNPTFSKVASDARLADLIRRVDRPQSQAGEDSNPRSEMGPARKP